MKVSFMKRFVVCCSIMTILTRLGLRQKTTNLHFRGEARTVDSIDYLSVLITQQGTCWTWRKLVARPRFNFAAIFWIICARLLIGMFWDWYLRHTTVFDGVLYDLSVWQDYWCLYSCLFKNLIWWCYHHHHRDF